MLRMLMRCGLLTVGFALTAFALAEWQESGFGFDGVWPFADVPQLHPLHVLVIGIAMIPPALWEIFLLDHATGDHRD